VVEVLIRFVCIMRNFLFFILLSLIYFEASAQNTETPTYLLKNKTNIFGLSTLSFLDPYLSPLTYKGIGLNYETKTSGFLSAQNKNIFIRSTTNIEVGIALNPQITSAMMYVGANYGWGIQYHFRIRNDLQVLVGGMCDVDFGMKDVERNVNNPVNIDLSTNLNITGTANYNLKLAKKTLRLQLDVLSPLLGCMFVPRAGASYYEMFMLGNLTDAVHFSSLYNKRGINSTIAVYVPFNQSVWKFGLKLVDYKYSANSLVFNRNELSLIIGTTFDEIRFAGRKNIAPKNFITVNE